MKNLLPDLNVHKLGVKNSDTTTRKMLMIIEGIFTIGVQKSIKKYGYTEQRYYQLLKLFQTQGVEGLIDHKRGPQTNSVRTETIINHIIRYRFLDPQSSSAVIAQKLTQDGFKVSVRSIERTIQEYGLQKKTLQIWAEKEKGTVGRDSKYQTGKKNNCSQ